MKKLLRILFVISAIAFVTTLTACADKKCAACADKMCATTGGVDKPAKTGGNAKTAKNPSILKFTAEANGVTIDTTKDVYKITINPSLLTYPMPWGTAFETFAFEAFAFAPIFTVTFTDNKQGFIIPTTVDKAEDLTTTHIADLNTALNTGVDQGADSNGITHSFLADPDNKPGFSTTELNADWSTLAPRAKTKLVVGGGKPIIIPEFIGVTDIVTDTKVRVSCLTTITGFTKDSFATKDPDAANNLAIAKGTETECSFSLVGKGNYFQKKAAYKDWAEAAVELAKDDSTKNIQKMGFVGIVTGDDTASAITKAAEITEDAETLGIKGFTADASAKLVKAYNSVLQKVEIVIAVAK